MFALSHNQVMSLVQIDWEAPDCPLKLNDTLTLADLKSSPLLKHTRLFLTHLDTDKGVKLTAKGNLNRKFVSQMLDKFPWPDYDVATTRRMHKVINEEDFMPLHFIRVICEVAKLTRKYKGHLKPSRLGRSLLDDDSAGLLMDELFTGVFQHFNLAYMDRIGVEDNLTPQMGLILYGISKLADNYVTPGELATLPIDAFKEEHHLWTPEVLFEMRVLKYLEWFGLMEKRKHAANDQRSRNYIYRKTALFDRFIRFEI
ncbi:hypothetical protein GCM10011332_31680 [Terasakiella brassicae]|uniref:Uncharacterized protein n=1 Tax=Terasakiella brassicae TaxID=1634917 RepID=A0A917FGF5_9PROT|nr:hypothetical protein [Terasakiella brassicae]GGF75365.1 hypothetical protein GCM10011332_31680 [Terasakiella brassicae]